MPKVTEPKTFSYFDPSGWVQIQEEDGRFFNDKPMVVGAEPNGMIINASHYPKGFWKPWHSHKYSHAIYVIDGAELTEEGDVYGPGSLVWDSETYEGGHGAADGRDCKFLWITNKDERNPKEKTDEPIIPQAWNVYDTDWEQTETAIGTLAVKRMVSDTETGFTVQFVRLEQGFAAPLHYMNTGYGVFVIQGDIHAELGGWKKNDFVWFPEGHRHEIASDGGALLLVITATEPELMTGEEPNVR